MFKNPKKIVIAAIRVKLPSVSAAFLGQYDLPHLEKFLLDIAKY